LVLRVGIIKIFFAGSVPECGGFRKWERLVIHLDNWSNNHQRTRWCLKEPPNTSWNPLSLLENPKIISSGAQYVTMWKCFSHPSLVMYFFATPPIKLKLGHQIGGGGITNSESPGRIRKTEQKLRSYILHCFLEGAIY
jgi:hypothetical protein